MTSSLTGSFVGLKYLPDFLRLSSLFEFGDLLQYLLDFTLGMFHNELSGQSGGSLW